MATVCLIQLLVLVFCLHGVVPDSREAKYMNTLCGELVIVKNAVRFILEPYMVMKMPEDCEVHIQAFSDYYIYKDKINIELSFLGLNIACEQGSVEILQLGDYDDKLASASGDSICGDEIPEQIFRSTEETITLKFHKIYPQMYTASFEILATKIDKGACYEDYGGFLCDNQACVDRDVLCDDYNNCRDGSDESDSECIGFWTTAAISGVVVGSVAGVIVLVVVLIVFRKIRHGSVC
ncbi:hypothetical protein SNE40_005191 [Patella caerulea]|uniref:CUB domain-containing protein n=1 Tax=Patella caerulea TaxID=87958 RepID=A0AAN8PX69_PATCE